jgi:hypothetical protein
VVSALIPFALVCFAVPAAAATLSWQNPGTGDWFDLNNWSPNQVPTSADSASISNGGTATATGVPVTVGSLTIGTTSTTAAATGTVSIAGGNLSLSSSNNLNVGTTYGTTGGTGTGTLEVAGAISGPIGGIFVGSNTAAGGTASGRLTSAGLTSTNPVGLAFLGVGRDQGGGAATGVLETGALNLAGPVEWFEVGLTVLDGRSADGTLRATSGDLTVRNSAYVGTHAGTTAVAGSARGVLELGGALTSLGGGGYASLSVGELSGNRTGTATGSVTAQGVAGFSYGIQVGTAWDHTTGSATGTLAVGAGGLQGGSLTVGTTYGAAAATGTVTVAAGGATLTGGLTIGSASGSGNASGQMTVAQSNVSAPGGLFVGYLSGASPKSANGVFSLTSGQLTAGPVAVGQGLGAGTVTGDVRLSNVVGQVTSIQIGESFNASATVSGVMSLVNSVLTVDKFVAVGSSLGGAGNGSLSLVDSRLNVGAAAGTPSLEDDMFVGMGTGGMGLLSLTRSLVDVGDFLSLGTGALLEIGIEGTTRGLQYGALDVYGGLLGGGLQVDFGFTPSFDEGIFDLIVSGTADGLSGAFSTIDIVGLDPAFRAWTEFAVDSVGGTDVEIFRLHVARAEVPVPEPPTALVLIPTGVAGVGFLFRARRRGGKSQTR